MSTQAMAPMAYPTNSLDRGLRLIQLVRDEGSIRVMDAAEELGVSRSSAHRLLQALVYRDFLARDEEHGYVAGPALSSSAAGMSWSRKFRIAATPHMRELADTVGLSANLMIRVDRDVRFLKSVTVAGGTYDRRGAIMAAHRTAGGKVMLARLDPRSLAEVYLRSTGRWVLDRARFDGLLAQLQQVRRTDFAVSRAEVERSVSAVGTALRGSRGEVLGALTLSARSPIILDGRALETAISALHTSRTVIENAIAGTSPDHTPPAAR